MSAGGIGKKEELLFTQRKFSCLGTLPQTPEVFGAIGVHRGREGKVAIDSLLNREGRTSLCSGN